MVEQIEVTGKTLEEARQAALEQLGVAENMIIFEIIEEPSKGFLGMFGGKPARIRATVKELEPVEKGEKFLKDIFAAMNLEVIIEHNETGDGHVFNRRKLCISDGMGDGDAVKQSIECYISIGSSNGFLIPELIGAGIC